MRVGNFSLFIPQGRERDSGHVELDHGKVYEIRLGNHFQGRRCDALVEVDGKRIGEFRINDGQTMTLERGPDDSGRFTFYRSGSSDAQKVGESSIIHENRGLVRVVFKPERYFDREEKTSGAVPTVGESMRSTVDCSSEELTGHRSTTRGFSFAPQNAAAGVTGLSGHSGQSFYNVSPLNYDLSYETTITLRLVCNDGPRELKPQGSRSANPVPEPVR